MSIHSETLRIRDVFSANSDLRVPPYQRGFAWTDREVIAMMKDLLEAFETSTEYFLGAMVLIQPRSRGPADVVDGQQRITTLTIILAVLRDLASTADESALLHRTIGHETFVFGEKQRWRVTLNHLDTQFFRQHIQSRGATLDLDAMEQAASESESESQIRIAAAVREVQSRLQELSDESRTAFTQWLLDEVSIVKVRVTEHNIAYKVFIVLNQRGMPLSDHDVLKSALIEKAGFPHPRDALRYSKRWNVYAAKLGSDAFEDMLKQIRAIYDRQMRGEYIDALIGSLTQKMTIATFIQDVLPRFVDAYHAAVLGNFSAMKIDPGVTRFLTFLQSIHHEQWRAPTLKYLTDGAHDPEEAVRFFRALERLAYMLQYTNTPREYRHRRYRRVMDAMDKGTLFEPGSPLNLTGEEKATLVRRLRGKFPNYPQRRALLMRINACVENGAVLPPTVDATVEHILPKTPKRDAEWNDAWANPQDQDDLIETLGNFTLLTRDENQEADRKSFKEKLEIFFRNGKPTFALTEDLRGLTEWTPQNVRERGERLVAALVSEWELDTDA
ncbi:MAG: DUF262 domain-containing HNH endonuclease family protein [Hyphomonadaceae bacterium]